MIKGETVTVYRPGATLTDAFGAPVKTWTAETVENVVRHPAEAKDYTESNRPEGTIIGWVLHFPKTYTASLRECRVEVEGELYDIEGDPQAYMLVNTPTPWNRRAYAIRTEG
jgi:hypothetical protein